MDQQPGPCLWAEKGGRDRLIARAKEDPEWEVGFADECWWSRVTPPSVRAWQEPGEEMRLQEQEAQGGADDPKAVACYGLWREQQQEMLLRFVAGRPVSELTEQFLEWVCQRLKQEEKKALLLVWDNASWHTSQRVRSWIKTHNRQVKKEGGVRIVVCFLPTKSPWLNPIEPRWVHGKRAVLEPAHKLSVEELMERVSTHYSCAALPLLSKEAA